MRIYICTNAELVADDYVGLESDAKEAIAAAYAEAAAGVLESHDVKVESASMYAAWRGGFHSKAGSRAGGYVFGHRSGWVVTHVSDPPQWLVDLIDAAADAGDKAARDAAARFAT